MKESTALAQRFNERLATLNISAAETARRVGVKPQNIQHWKRRGRIPSDSLFQVAEVLHCSAEWLNTGKGPVDQGNLDGLPSGEYVLIPFLDDIKAYSAISKETLSKLAVLSSKCAWYRMNDKSMLPTIAPNNLLLIDLSTNDLVDGAIVLLKTGSISRIRRVLLRLNGDIELRCDSEEEKFKNESLSSSDLGIIEVVGVVKYQCGPVN